MSANPSTTPAHEIFAGKIRSRKIAAALPIEEKLRRLVLMQQRVNEIRRSSNRPLMRVWELDQNENRRSFDITSKPPGTIEWE